MSTPNEDTRILALDCATATGWAVQFDGAMESGVQRFDLKRGESPGMRFIRFRQWLNELMERTRPELVVYERPERFRSGAAVDVCVGMTTRVQEIAAQRGVEYCPVGPTTVKKHATGNGNADKDAMIVAAAEWMGQHIEDWLAALKEPGRDNEADAICILAWALAGMPENAPAKRRKKAKVS